MTFCALTLEKILKTVLLPKMSALLNSAPKQAYPRFENGELKILGNDVLLFPKSARKKFLHGAFWKEEGVLATVGGVCLGISGGPGCQWVGRVFWQNTAQMNWA